jgi:hypothetical protein
MIWRVFEYLSVRSHLCTFVHKNMLAVSVRSCCVYKCAFMRTQIHMNTCACVHLHVYSCLRVCVRGCVSTCVGVCVRVATDRAQCASRRRHAWRRTWRRHVAVAYSRSCRHGCSPPRAGTASAVSSCRCLSRLPPHNIT